MKRITSRLSSSTQESSHSKKDPRLGFRFRVGEPIFFPFIKSSST